MQINKNNQASVRTEAEAKSPRQERVRDCFTGKMLL